MKCRNASETCLILPAMLALTSRASAMRSGRRSPLKNVTSCRLPSSRTWKSSPWSPITGWPVLSSTDTGTRTVRVLAPKVGPWATGPAGGKEESPPARADRGVAGADGAPLAGATRRTATISVSEAPASRSALSRGRSSSSPNPRSCSSARIVRSLMPARRNLTSSAVVSGSSPRAPAARARRRKARAILAA